MKFALCFTNFGPYHLARLRALATQLRARGDRLIAYEVAGSEQRYPWRRSRSGEPFEWITFFPDRALETIPASRMPHGHDHRALDRDRPDAIGSVGYVRPESMAAARWARRHGSASDVDVRKPGDRPAASLVERAGQAAALRSFDSALVGGPTHRDYLVQLGMPANRIALGYNAVDNDFFAENARLMARAAERPLRLAVGSLFPHSLPVRSREESGPLDQGVCTLSRITAAVDTAWHLVICGDGPLASQIEQAITRVAARRQFTAPGFFSPMRCRGGTLTPVLSCSRVCPSPGGSLSTRPPQAACRFWSRHRAGCALRSYHNQTA